MCLCGLLLVRLPLRSPLSPSAEPHAVPTTRDEAYARCDFLLERAVAEGGDYADVRDLMAETERQVAALPEAANLA